MKGACIIMKKIHIGQTGLSAPPIAVGCMRLAGKTPLEAETLLKTALELGLNFFDHADIYGGGKSEELFARAIGMNDDKREKLILQSKCGITNGRYDFSKKHILEATDGILKRLKTDYLDILLLHRPDALCEPEEVAEAFDILQTSGKVRHFGVSNHNPARIRLLNKYLSEPVAVNQLQFSLTNTTMLDAGLNVNMENDAAVDRDGSVLDFCRLEDITVQAWSPFQFGFFGGVFIDNPQFPELNQALARVAAEHGVTKTAVAVAWILRHPAHMQVVTGTTNPARLAECAAGAAVTLSREQWYDLYKSAGNTLP